MHTPKHTVRYNRIMFSSIAKCVSLTILLCFLYVTCQAQLTPVVDPYCKDTVNNCALYGPDNCHGMYEQWSRQHCNMTCKFCVGEVEPPCEDTNIDCDTYDSTVCNNPAYQHWAETSCRFHCRRCSPEKLALKLASLTTISPELCKNKLDCRLYGKDTCRLYTHWAKENCNAYCGFCKGIPTPPRVCADSIPNCASYGQATCADNKYAIWVQDDCPKYCGVCDSGAVTIPTVSHTANAHIAPTFQTPPPIRGK